MDRPELTYKERRFCEEFMIDFNATRAHERAGYKAKTDNARRVAAHLLLTKLNIKSHIDELLEKKREGNNYLAQLIIDECKNRVLFDPAEILKLKGIDIGPADKKEKFYRVQFDELDQWPPEIRRLIDRVEETRDGFKIWFVSKDRAMERIAKQLGLDAPQKVEAETTIVIEPPKKTNGDSND